MSKSCRSAVIKKYLVLNEGSCEDTVQVKVKPKKQISKKPPIFTGKMRYKGRTIDVIQANFSLKDPEALVKIQFKLTGDDNLFFTGEATNRKNKELAYVVDQELSSSLPSGEYNLLTFTYSAPPIGTRLFEDICFHTTIGVIDPEAEVERDPH